MYFHNIKVNPNFQGKAIIILVVTLAGLYIPAIYILLGASPFFTSDTVGTTTPLGSQLRELSDVDKNTGNSSTEVPVIPSKDAQKYGPRNSTLGFEKIFYISLPERTDRQQTMGLIASYMGLDFTYIPGVNGSTISNKALPYDTNNKPPNPPTAAELGCWQAHANVWSQILKEGISTALILEDDIDFTVGIRDVLGSVSNHLQNLTGTTTGEEYGLVNENSWDVLHLGHCIDSGPPEATHPISSKIYEAWEDEYAPVDKKKKYATMLPEAKTQRIRVLHPTYRVACTQAYVVSLAGARRLLYNVGGPGGPLNRPIDLIMLRNFKSGKLKGYTVSPSLFGQWKTGDSSKDSDIPKEQEWKIEKGSGENVVKGVLEEMGKDWGERNVWKEIESPVPTDSNVSARRRRRRRRIPKEQN